MYIFLNLKLYYILFILYFDTVMDKLFYFFIEFGCSLKMDQSRDVTPRLGVSVILEYHMILLSYICFPATLVMNR